MSNHEIVKAALAQKEVTPVHLRRMQMAMDETPGVLLWTGDVVYDGHY